VRRLSRHAVEVLAAFMRDPGGRHYGKRIADDTGILSGTLYPLLTRLEGRGLLSSEAENVDPVKVGRRPRKYYRLTDEGRRVAQRELAELRKLGEQR
jgi:PadR family transcriptional regulator, regulatory protein PadR